MVFEPFTFIWNAYKYLPKTKILFKCFVLYQPNKKSWNIWNIFPSIGPQYILLFTEWKKYESFY